jgi:hypothetical protein
MSGNPSEAGPMDDGSNSRSGIFPSQVISTLLGVYRRPPSACQNGSLTSVSAWFAWMDCQYRSSQPDPKPVQPFPVTAR